MLYGWGLSTGIDNKINLINVENACQVTAGADQQYVFTQAVYPYAWGAESLLGLGFESNESVDVVAPVTVDTLKEAVEMDLLRVLQISCGENHTLALV